MIPEPVSAEDRALLVDVARGRRPADVVVRGGRVVNVYSEEVLAGDVSVTAGRIAYVGTDVDTVGEGTQVIEADGAYVAPGFIEPHCHPWALYNPDSLAREVLPRGNTALVGETLSFQLLLDRAGVAALLRQLQAAPLRWFWAVRVAGQSGEPLDECFPVRDVEALLAEPGVVQIAEVTSWPQVLAADPSLLERTALAQRFGLRLDGHTAGASAQKVAGVAAAGFTADHEPISADEALARLRNGFQVLLRHSSLRPDLDDTLRLALTGRGVARLCVTSDGSGPLWIREHGMVDGLVRRLIGAGVPVARAVGIGSLNAATYLRLDEHLGGLAPGRCADLQVVEEFDGRLPRHVLVGGRVAAAGGELAAGWPVMPWGEHLAVPHHLRLDLVSDAGSYRPPPHDGAPVPAMRFVSAGIARADEVRAGPDGRPDGAVLAVLFSRDGRRRSWAWLVNFAPELDGLATSYTTSGDFLVIGRDPEAMALAARTAFRGAGGIAVVSDGRVVASMDLDLAGWMSSKPVPELTGEWLAIERAVKAAGYPFEELLYCLCFITCDFLPDLRLLADGLLEVKTGRVLVPAERL